MAIAKNTIVGPNNICPGVKIAVYQISFDTSYPTGGEALDFSGDFDFVYGIVPGGNDTLADNGYSFAGILPGATTAVNSTNCKVSVHWSNNTAQALAEFTNTGDLSAVGQLTLIVIGA